MAAFLDIFEVAAQVTSQKCPAACLQFFRRLFEPFLGMSLAEAANLQICEVALNVECEGLINILRKTTYSFAMAKLVQLGTCTYAWLKALL